MDDKNINVGDKVKIICFKEGKNEAEVISKDDKFITLKLDFKETLLQFPINDDIIIKVSKKEE